MIERVACDWAGSGAMGAPSLRYDLLDRLARASSRRGVRLLAFGIGEEGLRLVCEGDAEATRELCRALRAGTTRAVRSQGVELHWRPLQVESVGAGELVDAIAWAHRAPREVDLGGPLASPWSSHRDLLGFRDAPFYDRSVLSRRVDARSVHVRAGGRRLPGPRPRRRPSPEALPLLLRIAASVRGVLPADRRCFRLFVHLARSRGWPTGAVADALVLTRRRVRQLAAEPAPLLPIAVRALGDARLRRVP